MEDGTQSDSSDPDGRLVNRRSFLLADDTGEAPVGTSDAGAWTRGDPGLRTPWFEEADSALPWPRYPRPQLMRPAWACLNGVWEFEATDELPPNDRELDERILVPFPVESSLSGIERPVDAMVYRRELQVPPVWQERDDIPTDRFLLQFEAVDYRTEVYVGGQQYGTHTGGYDAFSVDITEAVASADDVLELVVRVTDPTDRTAQAVGKQHPDPEGIWYTPYSGIWQSVWLEPVPSSYITGVTITPVLNDEAVEIHVRGIDIDGLTVEATAWDDGSVVGRTTGPTTDPLKVPVPDATLWTPATPRLYDLTVRLLDDGETVDEVQSYFGMRSIDTMRIDGQVRPTLNGETTFQFGTLDQGYWPDGISTPPSDEALASDLARQDELGFNAVRKHVKVEPRRWYYHADRVGMLVWQDMPNLGEFDVGEIDRQWHRELQRMVEQHRNHPSIVVWVPLNEGWGGSAPETIRSATQTVTAIDETRLVNNMSGVNVCECDGDVGDIVSVHNYPGPGTPPPSDDRITVIDEFGGIALSLDGHEWKPTDDWGYEEVGGRAELTDRFTEKIHELTRLCDSNGLGAAIYTQWTDVETEINGLVTYDRTVLKLDTEQARIAIRNLAGREMTDPA